MAFTCIHPDQIQINQGTREILIGSRIVDWWSNLAISIVFGLGFSTFVTLILTPAVLALPYGIRNDFKKYVKARD